MATLPEVVVHHDFLDYVAAYGGLAGGLAAIVALLFAWLSKRDAKRSADASERSADASERSTAVAEAALKIAQEEAAALRAERERKAYVTLSLGARSVGTVPMESPTLIVLDVGVSNKGHRPADHVMVNVLTPNTLVLQATDDPDGTTIIEGQVRETDERLQGHRCWFWAHEFGPLAAGVSKGAYLRLFRPVIGEHVIRTKVVNEDLPGGAEVQEWRLVVPDNPLVKPDLRPADQKTTQAMRRA